MLLLFDVDGTLLGGAARAHGDALYQALLDVHGIDASRVRNTISPAGRTDGEIARALLIEAGVSARRIDERAEAVRDACCRAYAELCPPSLADCVLPGVPELLADLAPRADVRLALVTGNYEPVARLKLSRAGLGRYFPSGQGAFGSDAEDRAALPGIARRRAGHDGVRYPRKDTIVIGDTPRDIACARADGVRCFALATGPFHRDALTGADAVANDAHELRPILAEALAGKAEGLAKRAGS